MKFFILLIFSTLTMTCLAQNAIQGVVLDGDSNTPLPGANVFIANTTKGTSTDANGAFRITGLKAAPYELVITFIGYKTQAINIVAGEPVKYKVLLAPAAQQLREIVVHGKGISRAQRSEYLKIFKDNFVGKTNNAFETKLENPDDIYLDKNDNVLTAISDSAVVLRNNGLGYRVKVLLQTYTYKTTIGALHYEGYMVFEPMTPKNDREKKRWAKNRLKAYNGSQMHFIRALYDQRLEKDGFKLSLNNVTLDSAKVLKFPGELRINYVPEQQMSVLTYHHPAQLVSDGRFYPIDAITIGGYWSSELMSESLPLDYDPDEDLAIIKE